MKYAGKYVVLSNLWSERGSTDTGPVRYDGIPLLWSHNEKWRKRNNLDWIEKEDFFGGRLYKRKWWNDGVEGNLKIMGV